MKTEILHRDDLTLGGFAGLKEHRLVVSKNIPWRTNEPWDGMGSFVYLADARFNPHGDTRMHDHMEVDVISVILEGRIAHEGSLGHGGELNTFDVQVQRAGGEGFSHNEVNPDNQKNRMIQIWVLPEEKGQESDYKTYSMGWGERVNIYGGENEQFKSKTILDVVMLNAGESLNYDKPVMAYLAIGRGVANKEQIKEGDLVRADKFEYKATEKSHLIVVSLNE